MPEAVLTAGDFQAATGVSRETLERLAAYGALLNDWQKAVNLVGAATLPDLWRRHMLDSAQLLALAPDASDWVDLGSGAGFPGLVLAILGARDVHLIESDGRKCTFLREAARHTGTAVTVHHARIESVTPWPARVIVARALAPLAPLLGYAAPFFGARSEGLFLKGQDVDKELTEATKCWNMRVERLASISDPTGQILRVKELRRV